MHFGLLSSKTDPHPHEHQHRLLGDEKTGESIPSVNQTPKLLCSFGFLRCPSGAGHLRRWASSFIPFPRIMPSSLTLFVTITSLTTLIVGYAQAAPSLASHCKQGEAAYLNANMLELRYPRYETEEERRTKPGWLLRKTGKVLSICTDRQSGPFNSISYRFGAVGKVEFERVATKSSPFYVFDRTDSPHTGESVLFFSVGPYTYCVGEATGQGSGVSLTVLKAGQEVASFFSGNDRGTDYEAGLVDLSKSSALHEYRPKNEFQTPCDGKRLIRP